MEKETWSNFTFRGLSFLVKKKWCNPLSHHFVTMKLFTQCEIFFICFYPRSRETAQLMPTSLYSNNKKVDSNSLAFSFWLQFKMKDFWIHLSLISFTMISSTTYTCLIKQKIIIFKCYSAKADQNWVQTKMDWNWRFYLVHGAQRTKCNLEPIAYLYPKWYYEFLNTCSGFLHRCTKIHFRCSDSIPTI